MDAARLALVLLLLALSGCAGLPGHHRFTPVAPTVLPPPLTAPVVATGAIYREGLELRLFEDRTARRVGDILTIRLVERTDARKQASTGIDKDAAVGLQAPILFGNTIDGLETDIAHNRAFAGEAESDQSNSLNGQISAVVVGVYPNGNLIVRGEKSLTLNQGEEVIQISGVVRPDDIAADNSVLSTRVADAQITYAGNGALADANAVGWLGRFFLSVLWPF